MWMIHCWNMCFRLLVATHKLTDFLVITILMHVVVIWRSMFSITHTITCQTGKMNLVHACSSFYGIWMNGFSSYAFARFHQGHYFYDPVLSFPLFWNYVVLCFLFCCFKHSIFVRMFLKNVGDKGKLGQYVRVQSLIRLRLPLIWYKLNIRVYWGIRWFTM